MDKPKNLESKQASLKIAGMTCSACVQTIEGHLKGVEGVIEVAVSLLTNRALIRYDPEVIGLRQIV